MAMDKYLIKKYTILAMSILMVSCSLFPLYQEYQAPTLPTLPERSIHHVATRTSITRNRAGSTAHSIDPAISQSQSGTRYPACLRSIGQRYEERWGSVVEQGTDFNCAFRTPMYALWGGIIRWQGRTCWNVSCTSTSGGAIVIDATIPGISDQSMYYLHLDEIQASVFAGKTVSKGTLLGWSGGQTVGGHWPVSTWFSSGPHIEIGFCASFLFCDAGYNRNPLPYIESAIQ